MKINFYKANKLYGGGEFIILDTETNTYKEGNTASTAWNCWDYQTRVEVATYKALKQLKTDLDNAGAKSEGRK